MGLKRGSLVTHSKWGLCYLGGGMEKRGLSLHQMRDGKRLCKEAKAKDLTMLSFSAWRWYQVLDESTKKTVDSYKTNPHHQEPMGSLETARTYSYCHGADLASVICADAKVYVCCHLRSEERGCIGDLRQRSLAEIWADPRRREIVRAIDVSGCVPLCRCDQINRTIESLLTDTQPHKNFL